MLVAMCGSPGKTYPAQMETGAQISGAQISCFKPLSFGEICYVATDNWYRPHVADEETEDREG